MEVEFKCVIEAGVFSSFEEIRIEICRECKGRDYVQKEYIAKIRVTQVVEETGETA